MRKTVSPEAARFDGLRGKGSALEQAINAEYYVPGMIELEDGDLIWNWNGKEKRVEHFEGLLNAFAGLHSRSAERVLDFARRWGALYSCPRHPAPNSGPTPPRAGGIAGPAPPDLFCLYKHPKGHAEPIAGWQRMSKKIDGILRIAYDLAIGRPGAAEHWKLFYDDQEVRAVGQTVDFDRRVLREDLNRDLFTAGVRPEIRWDESWRIDFHVGSLYGALGAQTMLVIAQRGIAICAGCGRLFPPKQLRPGQDAYCDLPHCGWKAAVRKAQKRRYQKKKLGLPA
jgi:hypothetical protein